MKRISEFIIEKLKVSKSTITASDFVDAIFNYYERMDACEITALDIYGDFDSIPEIYTDELKTQARINFAIRPTIKYSNKRLIEIWEYDKQNRPVDGLIFVEDDDDGFEFLISDVFGDKEIIYDIYNYCA
jgi:hypothetical protein